MGWQTIKPFDTNQPSDTDSISFFVARLQTLPFPQQENEQGRARTVEANDQPNR